MKRILFLVATLAVLVAHAQAQRAPRIGYVYPAGGRQGATFQVAIGGQYLSGAVDVFCSGGGFDAKVVAHQRPMNGKETELQRDRLKSLEEKTKSARNATPAEAMEIAEIKERLALFANGRPYNTAIAESVIVEVSLASDAELGDREIRLATPGGLSNPLVFCIGQLPEFSARAARTSLKAEIDSRPRLARKPEENPSIAATLPAVLNGQILAGEVDRFRFTARKGERVLFAASARKLIPYLADAVPGWFQATLAVYDAEGRELAYADDFRFNPDPALCYVIPKDGDYEIEIRDAIYRGREDFVYRITAGDLPFITSIFPLGSSAPGTVQLRGWNLDIGELAHDFRGAIPGPRSLMTTRGNLLSNFVPFAVATLPDAFDKEPNNVPGGAQPLTTPVVVNGRIDVPGDVDVYRIQGKADQEIVAEIHARRFNSPIDSVLSLIDDTGRQLASNDDSEDKAAGLVTHHADSRLSAKLPADGSYLIQVTDAQRSGGPDYSYRLRVSPPQPDFELRVTPSSLSGRAGGSVPVTVFAFRKDGFAGDIALSVKGAPPGFKLSGGGVPAGKDQAKLTLTLSDATDEPIALQIEGHAKTATGEITRCAIPADDMQQAFAYHHLVPARELRVAVTGRLVITGTAKIVTATPVKIAPGGIARVQVEAAFGDKAQLLQFEFTDPPPGISMKTINITPSGAEIEFQSDSSSSVVGEKGNLVLHAFLKRTGKNGKPRRIPQGSLPAISFEIVSGQTAN